MLFNTSEHFSRLHSSVGAVGTDLEKIPKLIKLDFSGIKSKKKITTFSVFSTKCSGVCAVERNTLIEKSLC